MVSGANKRRLTILFLVGSLFLCLISVRNTLLISLGQFLITQSPLEKADAIIVLGGSVPDRILEAVDIYKEGYAPLIIMTRERKPEGYDELHKLGIKVPEGHDLIKIIALKLGVPESAIVTIDKRVDSTFSELRTIYNFLRKKSFKSVILVTSKYHTTRATIVFNRVTKGRIKVITRPSKYDSFNPENWWKTRKDFRLTFFEYQKLAHYYIFDSPILIHE